MADAKAKRELTPAALGQLSGLLGVVSVLGWIAVAVVVNDEPSWTSGAALWLGVAVLSGTYSAACLVLSRVRQPLRR